MIPTPVRLSVIAPVHNSRPHVPMLLERLAHNLDAGYEIILVDDASSDGSAEVLAEFASVHSNATLIELRRNRGVAHARNQGLAAAVGEYVWFVDDDDAWLPEMGARLLAAAESSDADMVICRADIRYSAQKAGRVIDGIDVERVVSPDEAWDLLLGGAINGYLWNKLIRRSVLGQSPFVDISSQSDFTGVVRALANCRVVHLIPDILYSHMVRAGSITRKRTPDLENLEVAHSVARQVHQDQMGRDVRSREFALFTANFLIVPNARTPTRVSANWQTRLDGLRRARDAARLLSMPELRAQSRRVHRDVLLITRFGMAYLAALHLGQVGRRWLRKVGRR